MVIRLRWEEKGISPTRGARRSRWAFPSRQARRKAASVGSPRISPRSPASALEQRVASSRANWASRLSRLPRPRLPEKATAVILFWVRVPVLSEQITPVLPKVSTAGMCRTMARCLASLLTPMASTMVTTAVSPSGMAATPRLTAMRNISNGSLCWSSPSRKMTPHTASTPSPRSFPVSFSRSCSGVWGASSRAIIPAIFPTAVSMPVAATTPAPAPAVTAVKAKAVFFRSPRGACFPHRAWASFSTGRDSPVKADSSVCRSTDLRSRRSAGTRSPAWRITRSPGTSWALSTTWRLPSRTTVAWGEESFRRAAMALSARHSWKVPMQALAVTMARMIRLSRYSPSPRSRETR